MLLSQVRSASGKITVVARQDGEAYEVKGADSVRGLALRAASEGVKLTDLIGRLGLGAPVDLALAYEEGRLLTPIHHDDPVHLHLTGTGLTHLGSAATRDAMHAKAAAQDTSAMTDSMKMFRMGLEGGRPAQGDVGAQPEWFYKGNGTMAVAPGAALVSPGFAGDAGEEPEIAGIYVIAADGRPFRVGFALGNEFSDHVTERVNYLWLAHSKLRPCSFGPELLVGDLPSDVQGMSRIVRGTRVIWEKPFASGEANMSHTLANLEHHHFKYDVFRHPGDVHVHCFGTATLSFADGVKPENGDIFEIEAAGFGLPLRNPLKQLMPKDGAVAVAQL